MYGTVCESIAASGDVIAMQDGTRSAGTRIDRMLLGMRTSDQVLSSMVSSDRRAPHAQYGAATRTA
jgi:hypothetical protein